MLSEPIEKTATRNMFYDEQGKHARTKNKLFKQDDFVDEVNTITQTLSIDNIRSFIDVFGSQPERLGTILMSAIAVLAMLVSKVLQKARELSAKLFDTGQISLQTPKQEPVPKPAEKERNAWELERDDLKGLARFTKKGELQSRIDCTYHQSHSAYAAYRKQENEWEKIYGAGSQRQDKESVLEQLKNPAKRTADYQQQKAAKSKERGAR